MPLDKPTISHQLKTVKIIDKKNSKSYIHANSNSAINENNQKRSHLKCATKPKLSRAISFCQNDSEKSNVKFTDNELKQCTKLLRNVLSSDALVLKHINNTTKNKSTCTDDSDFDSRPISGRAVGNRKFNWTNNSDSQFGQTSKSQINIVKSDGDNYRKQFLVTEDISEASITLADNTETESTLNQSEVAILCKNCSLTGVMPAYPSNNISQTNKSCGNKSTPVCCKCHKLIGSEPTDNNNAHNYNQQNDMRIYDKYANSKIFSTTTAATNHDPSQVSNKHPLTQQVTQPTLPGNYDNNLEAHNISTSNSGNTTNMSQPTQEKFDSLNNYLLSRLNELQTFVRNTRDADLDRIVSEIDRVFQLMIRENSLITTHLRTAAKSLKWENSTFKQKIKSLTESNYNMKTELKMLKQDTKHKIEELKLEVKVKSDEIAQLIDRDKCNSTHWKDKLSKLEKDVDKIRQDNQTKALLLCQKDGELSELNHQLTRYKEDSVQLNQVNQEVVQLRHLTKKYEADLQHNQSVIRTARDQVVSLLERHKPTVTTHPSLQAGAGGGGSSRTPIQNTTASFTNGDWVCQATSLQRVLSMASDQCEYSPAVGTYSYSNDLHNIHNQQTYNNLSQQSGLNANNITNISHSNQCDNNNSNHHYSNLRYDNHTSNQNNNANFQNQKSSNFGNTQKNQYNQFQAVCANEFISSSNQSAVNKTSNDAPNNNLSSTASFTLNSSTALSSSHCSSSNTPVVSPRSSMCDQDTPVNSPQQRNHNNWLITNQNQVEISNKQSGLAASISSVAVSTISSLKSSDDMDFRTGLHKLDCQINRLQKTLKSKLSQSDISQYYTANNNNNNNSLAFSGDSFFSSVVM